MEVDATVSAPQPRPEIPEPRAPQPKRAAEDHDCRCVCGSLVARVVPEGVELKCRRCKRTLIVPLSDASSRHSEARQAAPVHPTG